MLDIFLLAFLDPLPTLPFPSLCPMMLTQVISVGWSALQYVCSIGRLIRRLKGRRSMKLKYLFLQLPPYPVALG